MEFLIKCFLAICLIFGGKNSVFGDFDHSFSKYQPVVHFGRDQATFRSRIEEIPTSMSNIKKFPSLMVQFARDQDTLRSRIEKMKTSMSKTYEIPSSSYNIYTNYSRNKYNNLGVSFTRFLVVVCLLIISKICLCCCKKPSNLISTNNTSSNDLLV